jgi:hypothetical protein
VNITIKFPTRNRPEKFREVFEIYQSYLSGKHAVRFVVSMDEDDPKMNTDEIRAYLSSFGNVVISYGHSKTKIQAVNADLDRLGEFDILLLASDDMIPQQKSYDDLIAVAMTESFPDLDGVLAYKDGRRGDKLITFNILGRKYFDRFGYLYHPSYQSVYADNEFTDVAVALNRVRWYDTVMFAHGWADYVGYDELMQRNEDRTTYNRDHANYLFRKSRNFGISS